MNDSDDTMLWVVILPVVIMVFSTVIYSLDIYVAAF